MTRALNVAGRLILCGVIVLGFGGCAWLDRNQDLPIAAASDSAEQQEYDYLIGPGDNLQIFVWRNPEVSLEEVRVRPDGKITSPLVEDLQASGKSPADLGRDIEKVLSTYIRQPIVTVIIKDFRGTYTQQIRVIGQAATPQSLPYSRGMSLLDVMIAVGGLTEFAAGNRAAIVREVDGTKKQIPVRVEALLEDGEIGANVTMRPGDVLIIPESFL